MNNMIDECDLERRSAVRKGADALSQMRSAIDRAAREMAELEARYLQAVDVKDMTRLLSSAINLVSTGILPNARLGMTAWAQASLHALAKREESD